ncbi:MAG: DMT family transporter [Hyphomicrobiaceae bacterium]
MTVDTKAMVTDARPTLDTATNLRAIVAMVISMLVFSLSDVLMKIVGAHLPLGQLLVLRGLIGTVLIVLLAAATGAFAGLRLTASPQVFWRTVAEVICSILYFIALLRLPLADVAAISQFAPLAVMAGAALLLGEPVGWRRWSAAGVGFIGVMLVIKPATSAFQPAALIMLASMLFVAIRDLITRRLPAAVPNVLVTGAAIIGVMLAGAVMAPFEVWHSPTPMQWLLLLLSGVAVITGFMLGILAMRTGDIGVVSPFRYSFMVFAVILSFAVFNEVPDRWSLAGIALIVASGLYSLHRERVRRAEARAQAGANP